MDNREMMRIFAAEARRKHGRARADTRGNIKRAVREVMEEVLTAAEPAPAPPPKFDARVASAAEMAAWRRARGLDDDATIEWRDPPPAQPSPNAAALKAIAAETADRRRAADLAAGQVDMRTASPERAASRLRQLGADAALLGDLSLQQPASAPMPVSDPHQGLREAEDAARRELYNAKRISTAFREQIDVRELSPRAYRLYLGERGLNPDASVPATATPGRGGGK